MPHSLVLFAFATILLVSLPATAGYKNDIMEPWIGATQDELTAQWGYPQSANDLFKIDEETVIYTYRSERSQGVGPWRHKFGGPTQCVVSFTVRNKAVVAYKYEGENCPRFKRQPRAEQGHTSATNP